MHHLLFCNQPLRLIHTCSPVSDEIPSRLIWLIKRWASSSDPPRLQVWHAVPKNSAIQWAIQGEKTSPAAVWGAARDQQWLKIGYAVCPIMPPGHGYFKMDDGKMMINWSVFQTNGTYTVDETSNSWSSLVLKDITRLGKHHQLFEPEPYVLCKTEPSPAMRRADDQWKYSCFR